MGESRFPVATNPHATFSNTNTSPKQCRKSPKSNIYIRGACPYQTNFESMRASRLLNYVRHMLIPVEFEFYYYEGNVTLLFDTFYG